MLCKRLHNIINIFITYASIQLDALLFLHQLFIRLLNFFPKRRHVDVSRLFEGLDLGSGDIWWRVCRLQPTENFPEEIRRLIPTTTLILLFSADRTLHVSAHGSPLMMHIVVLTNIKLSREITQI